MNINTNVPYVWHPPLLGFVKCNVDAAFFTNNNYFSAGMCTRNSLGSFIVAKSTLSNDLVRPPDVETLTLFWAISWTLDFGLQNVIFETDCKYIVDHLSNPKPSSSDFNVIPNKCRTKLFFSPNSRVSFSRRQANLVNHKLVREAKSYANIQVFDHVPSCIFDLPSNEMI